MWQQKEGSWRCNVKRTWPITADLEVGGRGHNPGNAGSFWKMEKPEAAELPLAWCQRAQQGSPEDIWSFKRAVELRATSERRRGTTWSESKDSKEGLKDSSTVTASHLQGQVHSRWEGCDAGEAAWLIGEELWELADVTDLCIHEGTGTVASADGRHLQSPRQEPSCQLRSFWWWWYHCWVRCEVNFSITVAVLLTRASRMFVSGWLVECGAPAFGPQAWWLSKAGNPGRA